MTANSFKELFFRYLERQTALREEELFIQAWQDDDPALAAVKASLVEEAFEELPVTYIPTTAQTEDIYARIREEIVAEPAVVRHLSVWRLPVWRYAAVFLFISGAIWLLVKPGNKTHRGNGVLTSTTQARDVAPPATNRATLTLANGQQVYLDSAGNGQLAEQGMAAVQKRGNGQISYLQKADAGLSRSGQSGEKATFYNTLSNPRGSQVIHLTLSDGTKVWVNAGSSIRYPVIFDGPERAVEMTGEAYFEVAKNKDKPFYVSAAGKERVAVLGTSFNINAYTDEAVLKTTLLTGGISVRDLRIKGRDVLLQPGEQAILGSDDNAGAIRISMEANLEEVMAWKNGLFSFHRTDFATVMRQLSRWYDITVSYEGRAPNREFNGKINKNLTLDQVLRILTETHINYTIEADRHLVIRP